MFLLYLIFILLASYCYTIFMTHEPEDYVCPFCDWLSGNETEYKRNSDIVYQDKSVTAFIAPKWWVNNPGHVIVIPNQHHENLYLIPDKALSEVYKTVKKTAIAIRDTYENCTGTSTRQHNEPAGNQDVWHFHVHVYPRYENDKLYQNHDNKQFVGPKEREPYAMMLKAYLQERE
jgi:histidine triad (HIT) family protein